MTRSLALLTGATLALASSLPAQTSATRLFATEGRVTESVSRDGRRLYYVRNIEELRYYDGATGNDIRLLPIKLGNRSDLDLSRSGRLLAFVHRAEDGSGPYVWSLALDPKTGLAAGAPRRVSLLPATDPSISPDERWIAFHSPTRADSGNLVVVPGAGGPERVLARTPGWVWPAQWTPDGAMIYFAVNPMGAQVDPRSVLMRMPVAGGTPQRLGDAAAWGVWPGLSPDGRAFIHWSLTWDTVVTRGPSGEVVSGAEIRARAEEPGSWIDSDRSLNTVAVTVGTIEAFPIGGGARRVVVDSGAFQEPFWSPDGKRIAFARPGVRTLEVVNSDGSGRRSYQLSSRVAVLPGLSWAPDGRKIAYYRNLEGLAVQVLDLDTGADRPLLAGTHHTITPRWRSDSRALLAGAFADAGPGKDSTRLVSIREAGLDGTTRELRKVTLRCDADSCFARFANDSLVISWPDNTARATKGAYALVPFRGTGAARTLFTRSAAGQPVPVLSENGAWTVIREQDGAGVNRILNLVGRDGRARRITMGAPVMSGWNNPWISNDGTEMIVATVATNQDTVMTYHRVITATGAATEIGKAPTIRRHLPIGVSPDGRNIIVFQPKRRLTEFYVVDMHRLLRKGP